MESECLISIRKTMQHSISDKRDIVPTKNKEVVKYFNYNVSILIGDSQLNFIHLNWAATNSRLTR